MNRTRDLLAAKSPQEAAQWAVDNDLSELMADGEVVRERRSSKVVTALRMDLETQAAVEAAAARRNVGTSTLMRQIIEEWVASHRGDDRSDRVRDLVHHLDAARMAAASLATPPGTDLPRAA